MKKWDEDQTNKQTNEQINRLYTRIQKCKVRRRMNQDQLNQDQQLLTASATFFIPTYCWKTIYVLRAKNDS